MSGSSGLLRVVKFCRYLPEFGWTPTVITAHPRMYEGVSEEQLKLIPEGLEVLRCSGLNTKWHLSIRGWYPLWLALPDAWVSWSLSATITALRTIRRKKADLILTTFPIASAIWTGLAVHCLTGRPWIVDLRDTMTEDHHPRDPSTWRVWRWLEGQAVRRASLLLFTARSAIHMYLQRYPQLSQAKCLFLPNGYDEEDFAHLPIVPDRTLVATTRPLRLLHSGLVYPEERDPGSFFRALARLRQEGKITPETVQVVFRAAGFEDSYSVTIQNLGISDIVSFLPRIPYNQALQECADADALLVMQAANCDHQIPAKTYEYLRIGKPILALTTQTGDTAALLHETGGATIVDLANEEEISAALPAFLNAVRSATHPSPEPSRVERYARRNQAKVLAECLDAFIQPAAAAVKADSLTSAMTVVKTSKE